MNTRLMTTLTLLALATSCSCGPSDADTGTPTADDSSAPVSGGTPTPTEPPIPEPVATPSPGEPSPTRSEETPLPPVQSGYYLVGGYTRLGDACSGDNFTQAMEGTLVQVTAEGWRITLEGEYVEEMSCLLNDTLDPPQCKIDNLEAYWDSWEEDGSDWCAGTTGYTTLISAPTRGQLTIHDAYESLLATGYTSWPDRCYELECVSQITYELVGETSP